MKMQHRYFATAFLIVAAIVSSNNIKAQTSGPLFDEIAHLDSLQFAAFNARNLGQLMNYFDSSLELYQDNVGVRNYDQTNQAFGGLFKMSYTLTRKLVPGSMEVYPIKDWGAIETGQHTFSHVENGQLQTGLFKFMQIWQKKDGVWRVTREITYGH
jgi:hypothetical protein